MYATEKSIRKKLSLSAVSKFCNFFMGKNNARFENRAIDDLY